MTENEITPSRLESSLENGFTITVEIPPPKGIKAEKSLETARAVAQRVAGVNVTDNQRGIMRMSAMAFCHLLIDAGCEPVMQVCARDRNRLALQSDLLGAAALGIKNVCLMTGDHPAMGDHPDAKPVFDLDSTLLIQLAAQLSRGFNINGAAIKNHPDFYVGGVVNPFFEPIELEIMKTKKKISAGARFFQTQPFFDLASAKTFLAKVKGFGVKFLLGIAPLKSKKMFDFLNQNVLTTSIPKAIEKRITGASDPQTEGLKVAAELVNELRGIADGVHIMPIGQVSRLPELLNMIDEGKI